MIDTSPKIKGKNSPIIINKQLYMSREHNGIVLLIMIKCDCVPDIVSHIAYITSFVL